MSPERWKQVEALYHRALDLVPEQRGVLLEQADPDLRREVESLLAQPSGDTAFDRILPTLAKATAAGGNAPLSSDGVLSSADHSAADPHEAETYRGDENFSAGASAENAVWGPFRLLEKVGQGSFGVVYRAFDTVLEREVALKLLLPNIDGDGSNAKAVLKEARGLARVRHPNVVPVYGVDTFNGRVGFWSDFVHGRTLSSLLAVQGRFGAREAALIGVDVCKALGAVHAAGLLHRDIKAGNVMREDGGRILLMDFGLSAEHAENHSLAGTPVYMAPELFAGQPATVASDIYATGVLLYQLLTAKFPFEAQNLLQVKAAHDSGTRRSIYDERTDLPDALVRVVETALAPDPKNRFASAGQMIAALSESTGLGSAVISAEPAHTKPAAKSFRIRMWISAAAVLALVLWFTPLRQRLFHGSNFSASAGAGAAHADYLKAQDLLDHYYQLHKTESAIDLFQKTINEDPRFALAYAGLGRAYFIQFRNLQDPALIEKVQDACSKALALDRDLASAHVTLGMLYTWTTRNDLAAQELQDAVSLDQKNAEVWAALADLYSRQGRTKEVEPAFQKAADLAPMDWRWPNQLGAYYLANGRFQEAAVAFEQAAKLASDNAILWNNLGIAYRRQSKLDEAKAAFRKAIDLEPRDFFFANLGLILFQEGNYPEAAKLYKQSVDINPTNYRAYGNLASAYEQTPAEKERARETYLKAISLAEQLRKSSPRDASLLAQLGDFYASVGMAEQSVPLIRQATALAPNDPQVLFHAAQAYELMHQREKALYWIRQALAHKYSLSTLHTEPLMRNLMTDSRFAEIAKSSVK